MPSCITCDYDLHGLADTALCPECATPVARSTADRRLRNTDITWLTRITRGVVWLERCLYIPIYAALVVLVLAIVLGVAAIVLDATSLGISALLGPALLALGAAFAVAAGAFLFIYISAAFYATSLSTFFTSPVERSRFAVRFTSWTPIALLGFSGMQEQLATTFAGLPTWVSDIILSALILAFAFHNASLRFALRELARRTGDFSPARRKLHRDPVLHGTLIVAVLLTIVWLPYAAAGTPAVGGIRNLDILAIIFAIASLQPPLKDTARALRAELHLAKLAL